MAEDVAAVLARGQRVEEMLSELLTSLRETVRALEAHLDADTLHAGLKHRDLLCPCNQNEVQRARAAIRKAEVGR